VALVVGMAAEAPSAGKKEMLVDRPRPARKRAFRRAGEDDPPDDDIGNSILVGF
jgi:hypothetical protein